MKVLYIDFYEDAPANAVYILRQLSDGSALLQKYTNNYVDDLHKCWWDDCSEADFMEMIKKAQKFIPNNAVLYVEKPYYM